MKKLLGIVVLGLLITSCSNQKETALENCADESAINLASSDIALPYPGFFYSFLGGKHRKADNLIKEANSVDEKVSEQYEKINKFRWKNFKKIYKKSNVAGLGIIRSGMTPPAKRSLIILPDDLVSLPIDAPKVIEYKDKIMKEDQSMGNVLDKIRKQEETLRQESSKIYLKERRKIVKKIDVKRKSQVPTYLSFLEKCEMFYNKTPDSFLIKWK